MTAHNTDREQGVDFTDIDPVLADISYPITTDELVAVHGDRTIERTNAEPISIRDLFDHMQDETFESIDAVRQGILNAMPSNSVGRQEYSDRGGSHPEATAEADRLDEDESL